MYFLSFVKFYYLLHLNSVTRKKSDVPLVMRNCGAFYTSVVYVAVVARSSSLPHLL